MGYRSTLLIVVAVFGILFSLLYIASAVPDRPKVVTVIIPEGSSLESSERNNFEPAVIRVIVGVNNTVRWINQDAVQSSVIADSDDDPGFYNATMERCENNDYQNCRILPGKSFLEPGESFEYTFTKPGAYGYHSVPHPHKHGTVIVWSGQEILSPTEIESRPHLTEEDAAYITRTDMEGRVAPMHVDKFVLYPTYYGRPLILVLVHENGTHYYPYSGNTCMPTSSDAETIWNMSCGMGNELADAIKGHLAYIVDGSWQDASVRNCNHFIMQ